MSDLYLDNCGHTPNPRSSGNEYPKSIINLESRMWQLAVVSSSPCKSHLQGIWRQFGWILQRRADARVALGASSLPFRGSLRSCDKMGWMSLLLAKMGWMSSLLGKMGCMPSLLTCWEGSSPRAFSCPGAPTQAAENWWHRVTPPPRDPLFSKFTNLLGNRNTPLKGL